MISDVALPLARPLPGGEGRPAQPDCSFEPKRALKLDYVRITREIEAVTLLLRRRKGIDAWAGMRDGFTILVAEDSPDDAKLLECAIRRAGLENPVRFVGDGYEAIEYLQGNGKF